MKYKHHPTAQSQTAFLVLPPISNVMDSANPPINVVYYFLDIIFIAYARVYDVYDRAWAHVQQSTWEGQRVTCERKSVLTQWILGWTTHTYTLSDSCPGWTTHTYTLFDSRTGGTCTQWAISLAHGWNFACQRPASVSLSHWPLPKVSRLSTHSSWRYSGVF